MTEDIYEEDFDELDELFKQIGFTNGLVDNNFTEASLNYETVPYGTKGMLGYKKDKRISYVYAELVPPSRTGIEGWKVTGPTGCFVYIFTICGNVFYPERPLYSGSNCPKVTITSNGDTKQAECKLTPTKKPITIEIWIRLHRETKQGQEQPQQQQQSAGKVDKFRDFLLTSSSMEVEECNNVNSNYQFIVPPFSNTSVVCKDTTINIPIVIQQTGSSSTTAFGGVTAVEKVYFVVEKRTFKRLRRDKA